MRMRATLILSLIVGRKVSIARGATPLGSICSRLVNGIGNVQIAAMVARIDGPLDPEYEKFRKSARRAALRAAKVLDNMSPDAGAKQMLKDLPMP